VKTEAVKLTTDQVFSTLSGYMGPYVDQFNKICRTFQIYGTSRCAVSPAPWRTCDMTVRNQDGNNIPLGT